MFTATRPARPGRSTPDDAPPTGSVDHSPSRFDGAGEPDFAGLVERHGVPLVVLDIGRAARQYRAVCAAFPLVEVHYDVSALAHPALIEAIASNSGYFEAAHDGALAALTSGDVDLSRVLHATATANPQALVAAYNAGVRRFVVDSPAEIERFVGFPSDLSLIARLRPEHSPRAAHALPRGIRAGDASHLVRFASTLGIRVAGFSLGVSAEAGAGEYIAGIARTVALMADIESATGCRFDTLDLGEGFPGTAGHRAADAAELARGIRAIVSPATSHVEITASADRAVTGGCITVIGGTVERDVDPLVASDCIDRGAEVAIVGGRRPAALLPFFRAVTQSGHRILRGTRTWSSAG
ncbi:hypothetical protein [Leifsonia poae]|uniref:hypothetical protein n=1 Tax=Leifsonia poae TaxID=110933 RepID=UPI001CC0B2CF|nr:hypothetical protein [Leifsonia poae]